MPHAFDRRSFLAGGAALGAGLVALESASGWAGAALTNGPGRNGVSTASPKRGGSIVFGIDTEEGGFNPTSARWDEGGFLYGRTVFDPLAIVTAAGKVEPYLAQSITSNPDYTVFTITLRSGINFHDGTPLNAAALELNLQKQQASILTGPAFANIESIQVTGPLTVTVTTKTPWEELPYALAEAQTAYIAAPSMLNAPDGGTTQPVGTGPFVFKEWTPNSHFTATANPHYWRPGLPYLDSITFKPIIDPGLPGRCPGIGHHRHHAHQYAADLRELPPQLEVVLRGRQRVDPGPAGRELHHAQHRSRSLQQPQAAEGPGDGHQFH